MQDTTLGSDYVSESDSNVLSCIPVNSRFSYQQINDVDLPVPAANQLWSNNEEEILLGLKKKRIHLKGNSKQSGLDYVALATHYRDAAKEYLLENTNATGIYMRNKNQIENKIKKLKKLKKW